MSPGPQDKLAVTSQGTEGHPQSVKHESPPPQQARWPPSHVDSCAQGFTAVPIKLEATPIKQEAHMPFMTADSDSMGMAHCSFASQDSSGAGDVLKQALGPNGEHNKLVVIAPAIGDEKQMEKQMDVEIEPSGNFNQKEDAMLEAYAQLRDEEEAIQNRIGTPSAKPNDRVRLLAVKQELQRIAEALEENEILEDINVDVADEMKAAQDAIGVNIHALRTSSSVKPASSTRKSQDSTKKRRKKESGNANKISKKRKLNQAPKNQVKNADAVSKYMFDQLAGKGTASIDKKNLKGKIPPLGNLGRSRNEEAKKIKAAANKIVTKDTKASIDSDIRAIFLMTKPFGKSCTLKLLHGYEGSDEDRNIDEYAWEIRGMDSALRHHQLIAAGYMCIMERSDTCGGGLLFDYMGYGKTVESLALIIGNKPTNVGKDTKGSPVTTTLVVVPTAVARQWVHEVKLHCPRLKVGLWTKNIAMEVLLCHDILIITYPELRVAHKEAQSIKKGERENDNGKSGQVLNHPLFETNFYRIILDEMHEIKGYRNPTYNAAMALNTEHKWGLTATPTPNGIEELFPYLKFIGHPGVTSMKNFRSRYVGGKGFDAIPEEERFERLRELLAPVMIMRTPSQSFLGDTLLKLPQAHALPPIEVRFSKEEQVIYRFLDKQIQDQYTGEEDEEEDKREGEKEDEKEEPDLNLLNGQLVRLRQCAASPLLLEKPAKEGVWTLEDLAMMRQEVRNAGGETTPFIDQIERWILNNDAASPPAGSTRHSNYIANARAALNGGTCPGTGCEKTIEQLTEPQVAECGHRWCKFCLEKHIKFEKLVELRDPPECSRCHKPLGQTKPYSPDELGDETAESMDQDSTAQERPGEDYNGKQPRVSGRTNIVNFLDQYTTTKIPRSAKVDAVIRTIVEWQNQAPEDKIIVFIQWVDLNGILGRILQEEGIKFLYYTSLAVMKNEDRVAALETFEKDPCVKVLICSLRCGGQALNLTCANRTIMVDLWWNHSVEAQATARVYRMGQQKETYSVRIIVEDSIDQNIYNIQKKKLELLKNSFQEFEADKSLDRETLYELLGWRHVEDETLSEKTSDDVDIDTDGNDDSDASYKP